MERTKMLMGSTHSQMSTASDRMELSRARLNPVARWNLLVFIYKFILILLSIKLDLLDPFHMVLLLSRTLLC